MSAGDGCNCSCHIESPAHCSLCTPLPAPLRVGYTITNGPDDREQATVNELHSLVKRLNELVLDAAEQGIETDLNEIPNHTISRISISLYTVTCKKRLKPTV